MKDGKRVTAAGAVTALFLTLFIISAAVVVTLNFRWLYYMDIHWLQLPTTSGMSSQMIRENYDALIDYNMLWNQGRLVFPSLVMSQSGEIHFAEVKRIFDWIQIILIISGFCSLLSGIYQSRKNGKKWLNISAALCVILPCVLGALTAINWDAFFVGFHKLVFQNDYWLFDPVTDPVIKILPDTYFLQCAVCILMLIILGSVLCVIMAKSGRSAGVRSLTEDD